ncbi:hypothetical protein VZT92_008377 [Zoarces viviparus]|uniref:L1 transposable element RRM domain-containing protein n=2 Tax=Zoarces viviparus TaxID=48416 RepID=A0AAW1FF17_ZOAVI
MGKKDTNKKSTIGEPVNEDNTKNSSQTHGQDGGANANSQPDDTASLTKVLEEIRDFRKDTKHQLNDISSELANVNQKIAEAETRIESVEDRVQNLEQVLGKMIRVMDQQENKLLDQEGRSRRENLRIYNVPEGAEGSSMVEFVEKLICDTLEIPPTTDLGIERAHRALAPKPTGDREDKSRSIIIRFHRYKIKEEILRKAWGKKRVLLNERLIYFDQDYPPTVVQNRKKYSEAKRALKQRQIRFQTPYPAKLRVFYEDGTRLYQSAEEATADMKERGMSA